MNKHQVRAYLIAGLPIQVRGKMTNVYMVMAEHNEDYQGALNWLICYWLNFN